VDLGGTDLTAYESEAERLRDRSPRVAGVPEATQDGARSLDRLASDVGNRAFGQLVARMQEGEGILAGGLVHPDVEAAIAAASGRGLPLASDVSARLGGQMDDPLADVRVHTGESAAALARAVSARAFTVGSDIFFGAGEYRPGTGEGDRLLAHEVAHVIQQRGAPSGGPLSVSQPGDALEREAEALARDVSG
jgi:Domain of unknown function (DUF4157)